MFFDFGVSFLGELILLILILIFVLDGDDLLFVIVILSLVVFFSCTGNVLGGRNIFSLFFVKRRYEGGIVICMLLIFRVSGCLRFSFFDIVLGKVRSCLFFVVCVSFLSLVFGLDLGVGVVVSLGGGCEIGEIFGKEFIFVDGKVVGGRIIEDGFKWLIIVVFCNGFKIERFGIVVNVVGLELIIVVWAGELIVGLCLLKVKLVWDSLKVFRSIGMGVVVRLIDFLLRIDFREFRVVLFILFFFLVWLYFFIFMGFCFIVILGVVIILVDIESGEIFVDIFRGIFEEIIVGFLICWDIIVVLMVLLLELSTEIGYIFIVFVGFGCFIVVDFVTYFCEKC